MIAILVIILTIADLPSPTLSLSPALSFSGRGTGTQERPWSTTRNQDARHYIQLMNLPLLVLCGNRPDGAFPTSSLSGARFTVVPSSVLCGSNGRVRVSPLIKSGVATRGPDPVSGPVGGRVPVKRKMARDGAAVADDKSPMKAVTPELVAANLIFFSFRHMNRKLFPVIHRNLTLAFREPGYVFRSDMRSLCKLWTTMTKELRRVYMKDADTASRTWFGVFVSSTAFPLWVKSVNAMAHHRSVALAQPSNGKWVVPIYRCLENAFSTMNYTPMPVQVQIEALYVMMAQKSLDLNTMILSSFQLHVMGLKTNCDIHVLALACHDESLTTEQTLRYESFCEFLLNQVAPEDEAKSGVVHDGFFKPLKLEQVLTCCEFGDPTMHGDIEKIYRERNTACLKKNLSVYIDLGVDVITYEVPESIRAVMDVKKASAGSNKLVLDPFVCASSDTLTAQLFASQMTDEAEALRVFNQGGVDKCMKMNQQLASWWNIAATSGTRLPGKQPRITVLVLVYIYHSRVSIHTHTYLECLFLVADGFWDSQSDKYNVEFDPVFTTGHYYSETITNLGTAQGLTRPVLSLFNLHEDASREELLLKILTPYMRSKNITSRKIPSCLAWKKKILDGTTNCFKLGVMPHMGSKAQNAAAFDELPCGVKTVLGMDIVWLIISQVTSTDPPSLPCQPSLLLVSIRRIYEHIDIFTKSDYFGDLVSIPPLPTPLFTPCQYTTYI